MVPYRIGGTVIGIDYINCGACYGTCHANRINTVALRSTAVGLRGIIVGKRHGCVSERGNGLALSIRGSGLGGVNGTASIVGCVPKVLCAGKGCRIFNGNRPIVCVSKEGRAGASKLSLLSSAGIGSMRLVAGPKTRCSTRAEDIVGVAAMRRSLSKLSNVINTRVSGRGGLSGGRRIGLGVRGKTLSMFLTCRCSGAEDSVECSIGRFGCRRSAFRRVSTSRCSSHSHSRSCGINVGCTVGGGRAVNKECLKDVSGCGVLSSPFSCVRACGGSRLLATASGGARRSRGREFRGIGLCCVNGLASGLRLGLSTSCICTRLGRGRRIDRADEVSTISRVARVRGSRQGHTATLGKIFT